LEVWLQEYGILVFVVCIISLIAASALVLKRPLGKSTEIVGYVESFQVRSTRGGWTSVPAQVRVPQGWVASVSLPVTERCVIGSPIPLYDSPRLWGHSYQAVLKGCVVDQRLPQP
jgi:hypothetical protein